MFKSREYFPVLNKLHNLKHIVHDFIGSGKKDEEVVRHAKKTGRILISKNVKHMQDLCRLQLVPLICVTETMPNEEIDKKIVSILKNWNDQNVVKITHSPRKNL
jgi:predicted nuclease of predicted toxin-antitoxin system